MSEMVQVTFTSNKHLESHRGVLVNLLEPLLYIEEGRVLGDVIHHKDTMGTMIKCWT
uniref:Uncharacterized protein n=1 Tax=Arcella intermedia TaxID=1963864 RepID=A0A6B2LXH0_9EUKA